MTELCRVRRSTFLTRPLQWHGTFSSLVHIALLYWDDHEDSLAMPCLIWQNRDLIERLKQKHAAELSCYTKNFSVSSNCHASPFARRSFAGQVGSLQLCSLFAAAGGIAHRLVFGRQTFRALRPICGPPFFPERCRKPSPVFIAPYPSIVINVSVQNTHCDTPLVTLAHDLPSWQS